MTKVIHIDFPLAHALRGTMPSNTSFDGAADLRDHPLARPQDDVPCDTTPDLTLIDCWRKDDG